MPSLSEKGSAPLFIMIGLFFLAGAIVAGSYYVKNFTQILKSQASETTTVQVNQQNLESLKASLDKEIKNATPTAQLKNSGFIIHYSLNNPPYARKFNISTQKDEPFLTSLQTETIRISGIIPNASLTKFLVTTIDATQQSTNDKVKFLEYYVCSDVDCVSQLKIDKQKVTDQLSIKDNWQIRGWVHNSDTKLIIQAHSVIPGSSVPKEQSEIAVLDISSMQLTSLLNDSIKTPLDLYLDPATDLLAVKYATDDLLTSKIATYSLSDNKRTDYAAGKIDNARLTYMAARSKFGPYYVQAKKDESEGQIKNLEVYSSKGDFISMITVPGNLPNWYFQKNVSWSATDDYFAVFLIDPISSDATPKKVYFYTKEGGVIGFADISNLKQNSSVGSDAEVGIFSPDRKHFLLHSDEEKDSNTSVSWYLIPIENNAKISATIKEESLGTPLFWVQN